MPLPVPLPLNTIIPIVLTAKINENVSPRKGRVGVPWEAKSMGKRRERTLAGYKWPDVRRDLGTKPGPSRAKRATMDKEHTWTILPGCRTTNHETWQPWKTSAQERPGKCHRRGSQGEKDRRSCGKTGD